MNTKSFKYYLHRTFTISEGTKRKEIKTNESMVASELTIFEDMTFLFRSKSKKIKLLSGWTIERKSILTIIPVCLTHGNKFDLWFDKQDLKCLTFFNVQEDSPKKGGEKNYSETICNEFKDRTLSQWNEMKPNLELK